MKRFALCAGSIVVSAMCLSGERLSITHAQAPAAGPSTTASSSTVLADGRHLVIGGVAAGKPLGVMSIVDAAGATTRLAQRLEHPRGGHTATMLGDGRVLIVGGIGRSGGIESQAEIFDPTDGTLSAVDLKLSPRSGHTATLLTDGRVLLTGGLSDDGTRLDTAELWNPSDSSVTTVPLGAARSGHHATLQEDGTILLTGGGPRDEVFVPGADVVVAAGAAASSSPVIFAGSLPIDGELRANVQTRISLRFSGRLTAASVGSDTVRLSGPGGLVSTSLAFAEGGRLIVVTPRGALTPNSRYVLSAHGLRAFDGTSLSAFTVGFNTAGAASELSARPHEDDIWRVAGGRWRTGAPRSPWQDLPPLVAPGGATALAGQVLRLNGTPLAGVEVEISGRRGRSDRTGRFLLTLDALETGRHVLEIHGASANQPGRTYGFFEAGVQVVGGETTPLPFTIWMPAIDTAHEVTIPSPTTQATVITTPYIPGLELHLPAGTVIRDEDGSRVTKVSITPIPVDRTPFPLPAGAEVPIYFTIQPGGAYVATYGSGRKGARLHYPNYTAQAVGTRMDFWHYEPEDRGWYVYGRGEVEPSGRQVIPDPGVGIYEFTGAMISTGGTPPSSWPTPGGPSGGDPVDLASGLFVMNKTDLVLRDVLPIALTRTYRPGDTTSRTFGIGSTHAYDLRLWRPSTSNYDDVALILPDGGRIEYDRIDGGTGFLDMVQTHTSGPTAFYGSVITWNGTGFDLTMKDGTVLVFGDYAPLQAVRDRFGNTVRLVRNPSGTIARIESPNGRWIALTYDVSNRITDATDNLGRTVTYTYASNRLWKVTDAAGGVTEYTYDTSHRMLTIKDARGITYLTNTYDSNGRVDTQTLADGGVFEFDYTLDGGGKVTQTDLTDPRGFVSRFTFNSAGYHTSVVEALGTSLARTTTLVRDSGSQQVTSVTDPLNRETAYAYNSNGHITSIVRLSGTVDAVTTSFTYEPADNQIASVTDPLNHTTTFAYDYEGHLTTVADALNHQTTFTYNTAGQPLTVTNALNETVTFGYSGGDLVSMTSPLGQVTTLLTDGAGRVIRTTDPSGRSTQVNYDALDLVTSVIDAMSGVTSFTYDANGNLLTLTDARNKTTTWTYNNMDRAGTRTDPLSRQESYTYDVNGNPLTWIDRKGQVTSYTHDSLNRLTFTGYGTTGTPPTYASTVTTSYDAGDRATQIVDSGAGTISRAHDLLDRLTQEVTPEGTVNYTYDAAGRRSTMTVAGQTLVSYTYDDADRLTGVTQGSASVALVYDDANRRTSLTLPNGIVLESTHDDDSQLTALTYKLGGVTIGDLTYGYDGGGQRVSMGGSYARTGLPSTLTSATYDDANQIATWGGTSFSYDDNGNLTSDGAKTYTWNARNQMTGLSGGSSASFAYDGLGRRRSRTVSSTTTQFLYDGLNPVQELASGTPIANLLTGLGIDEYFSRTDSAGARHYLVDGLGSSIALADGSGTVQTNYTYEPFGTVTTSGASNSNSVGFTGRENDGTGLNFYRARYYDPARGRFVSEDPAVYEEGDPNLYRYVWNNPISLTDPSGNGVCKKFAQILILLCQWDQDEESLKRPPPRDRSAPEVKSGPRVPGRPSGSGGGGTGGNGGTGKGGGGGGRGGFGSGMGIFAVNPCVTGGSIFLPECLPPTFGRKGPSTLM